MANVRAVSKRRSDEHEEPRILKLWRCLQLFIQCIVKYVTFLWLHNPLRVLLKRQQRLYFVETYGEVMIQPKLKERILDIFLSDYRRRKRLLNWVHSRLRHNDVTDFSTCWNDGTVICALLESICPGVCPSFHLLSQHNRVRNCRLGLKLANKYLYVPMDLLSPEELAIATSSTEAKVIQYISMIKWASENIKEKWASLHESLIAAKTGRCFVKGSGLRNGIVGKRSKFTIIVSDTIGVFNLLIELRGPNNEYCGERVVSLHQAKGVLDNSFNINHSYSDTIKYVEDAAGNCFIRKKVPSRYPSGKTADNILLDFQCGEEGTFYVTFVPRRAGLHSVVIKWHNHNVENSPFRVKIYKASNVSSKNMKGAHEKRVIYDHLSFGTHSNESQDGQQYDVIRCELPAVIASEHDGNSRSLTAIARSKAYTKGRQLTVTRRRVLRRIITRNGEDIVIEEAISPSLSRQSSITDNSDDDLRLHSNKKDKENRWSPCLSPVKLSNLKTVVEEKPMPSEEGGKKSKSVRSRACRSLDYLDNRKTNRSRYDTNDLRTELAALKKIQSSPPTAHAPDHEQRLDDAKTGSQPVSRQPDGTMLAKRQPAAPVHFTFELLPNNDVTETAKRSLQRSTCIHERPRSARRTSSDGPIYALRRNMFSFANSDVSESSSNMSSDSPFSVVDEPADMITPTLKLLQSQSFKKSCLYVTEKNKMASTDKPEVDDSDPLNGRARELPITRKMWQRETIEEPSVPVDTSTDFPTADDTSRELLLESDFEFEVFSEENQSKPGAVGMSTTTTQTTCDSSDKKSSAGHQSSQGTECAGHTVDNEVAVVQKDNSQIFPDDTDLGTVSTSPNRTHMQRQWIIGGEQSSVSLPTNSSYEQILPTAEVADGVTRTFQAIQPNAAGSCDQTTSFRGEVLIVTPTPKTDKTTQVHDAEIIAATGWDKLEGVYFLLRRVCLKLPNGRRQANDDVRCCDVTDNEALSDSRQHMDAIPNASQNDNKSNMETQKSFLTLPRFDCVPVMRNAWSGQKRYPGSHGNITAWFERNERLQNGPAVQVPARQCTTETIDSGFDDNPPNYHRMARNSLPSLRNGNGHTRLYRKHYTGQIPLDPKLIRSASSGVNSSAEGRELGNEADDELCSNTGSGVGRPRRRQRLRLRQDSFSMSDSEINDRRQYSKLRTFIGKRSSPSKASNGTNLTMEGPGTIRDQLFKVNKKMEESLARTEMKRMLTSEDSSTLSQDVLDMKQPTCSSQTQSENMSILLKQRSSTRSNTSLDSAYNGFGVSRPDRRDLLSQIKEFQNLFPTADDNLVGEDIDLYGSVDNTVGSTCGMNSDEELEGGIEDDGKCTDVEDDGDLLIIEKEWDFYIESASGTSKKSGSGELTPSMSDCRSEYLKISGSSFGNYSDCSKFSSGGDSENLKISDSSLANESDCVRISDFSPANDSDFLRISDSSPANESDCLRIGDSSPANANDCLRISDSSPANESNCLRINDSNPSNDHNCLEIRASSSTNESDCNKNSDFSPEKLSVCHKIGESSQAIKNENMKTSNSYLDEFEHIEYMYFNDNKTRNIDDDNQGKHDRPSFETHDKASLQSLDETTSGTDASWEELADSVPVVNSGPNAVRYFGAQNQFALPDHRKSNLPEDNISAHEDVTGSEQSKRNCIYFESSVCDVRTPDLLQTFDMFSSFDLSHLDPADCEVPRYGADFKRNRKSDDCVIHVTGAGLRHGQIGPNSFQVWIETPPVSADLSVKVIGLGNRDITQTSVMYTGDNLYEVSYVVSEPGFYKIFIKMGDTEPVDSPFICEVTS